MVDDPSCAVAAFSGQVQLTVFTGELNPVFQQKVDRSRTALNALGHRRQLTQPGPSLKRVLDVQGARIRLIEHGRHSALSVISARFGQLVLGEHRYLKIFGQA